MPEQQRHKEDDCFSRTLTSRISKSRVLSASTMEMMQVLPETYCLASERCITSVEQSSRT